MSGSNLSLSERATLTWRNERPMKEAAQLELRMRYLQAVRIKLTKMFGSEYEIKTGIDDNGNIIAEVDDIRFDTCIYNEDVITIIPIILCPWCDKDAYLGAIEDLAELGEALEEFVQGLRHDCRGALVRLRLDG